MLGPVVSGGSPTNGSAGCRTAYLSHSHWTTVQRGHAVANGLPVVSVNRVGFEPDPSGQTEGIQFWGSSMVVGPQGEVLYRSSADEEESIIAEVDLAHSEDVRRWWPFLRDRRIDEYGEITKRFID